MNSLGEHVSLLNDDGPISLPQKPSPQHHPSPTTRCLSRNSSKFNSSPYKSRPTTSFSRKSSCSSHMSSFSTSTTTDRTDDYDDSPAHSPGLRPTPLFRFDSTSSQQSLQTPSPMTPMYPFDPLDPSKPNVSNSTDALFRSTGPYFTPQQMQQQQQQQQQQLLAQSLAMPSVQPQQTAFYSAASQATLLPFEEPYLQPPAVQFSYATDLIPPTPIVSSPIVSQAGQTSSSTGATSPTAGPKTAKKKYPCPHAARYNCTDTFTTSGHAARHGKKHTGEKNIHCPTCNKAFTRKDNMKQHERTHRQGRDQASTDAPPKRSSNKSSSSTELSSTAPDALATEMDLDIDPDSVVDPNATIRARRQTRPTFPPVDTPAFDANLRQAYDNAGLPLPVDGQVYKKQNMGDSTASSAPPRSAATRPPIERNITGDSVDGEGESPGLDALAMAAGIN